MSEYGSESAQGAGGGGASITWTNTMQAVFTPYVTCMNNFGIDLSSYSDVSNNIESIKSEIDSGNMPKGTNYQAQWKASNGKALFDQWYAAGYPE